MGASRSESQKVSANMMPGTWSSEPVMGQETVTPRWRTYLFTTSPVGLLNSLTMWQLPFLCPITL